MNQDNLRFEYAILRIRSLTDFHMLVKCRIHLRALLLQTLHAPSSTVVYCITKGGANALRQQRPTAWALREGASDGCRIHFNPWLIPASFEIGLGDDGLYV